jgi:hypothetical protein
MDAGKFTIEQEVAGALLDVGISMPLKTFRIPLRKKPVQFRVTVKRPTAGSIMRIDRLYLQTEVTLAEYRTYTMEQRMRFRVEHGNRMMRILALGICRGLLSGYLFSGIVAWFLKWFVEDIYLEAIFDQFVSLVGTQSFETIIKSLEENLMTSPMNLSQKRKGS